MYRYYTKGVCSKSILMDIEDDILKDVTFEGGCSGNLIGIKHLIEGKSIDEIIEDLDKIFTPDQKQAIEKEVNELYKQNILKEYRDQIGPSYYE